MKKRWLEVAVGLALAMGCMAGPAAEDMLSEEDLSEQEDGKTGPAPGEGDVDGATSAALTSAYGTISWTGGRGLNVRSGPGTSHAVAGWVPEGRRVRITCQSLGVSVGGNVVWDYLPDLGGYVSDYFMSSGYASWIPGLPRCSESAEEEDAGPLTIPEILPGSSPASVSQGFGYTAFAASHASWYTYCHSYGDWSRPIHCAMDIAASRGEPLYAPADATVITAGGTPYFRDDWNYAAGELKFELPDGTHVIYGHLSRIDTRVGQTVREGDPVGVVGSSNGSHLHLEVRVPDASTVSGYRTVDPGVYFGW